MNVFDLFNLRGKTAIVTGGGRGLGEQMAHSLAEAGANVVVCSRNIDACKKVSEDLRKKGVDSLALACDVSVKEEIEAVIEATLQHFGKIDILVNNSGTSWVAPILDYPEEKWDKVMNVNLKGIFLFSQSVAKIMCKQGHGKIINISSVNGFGGTSPKLLDAVAYNTSKGAVMTLTKEFAVKLAASNIQVNSIAPGLFPTKMSKVFESFQDILLNKIPAQRFGGENDLKGAVLFLASNASNYVTGQTLVVDGGLTSTV